MSDPFFDLIVNVDPDITNEITTTGFIDTGCYAFNALISASIFGGFPNNRVVALAGAEATGKSFFAMTGVKTFLENHPDGRVLYFDTEFAMDKSFFNKRGIDGDRVHISQPSTLEDFRTKVTKILNGYEKMDPKERPPILMVLDSLGNLPSDKEVGDADEGKNVKDMTKTPLIRSIFRIVTQKIGKMNIPMLVCNHTYAVIGAYMPTNEMSGGGGLKYAASTILFLSKRKDKDGTDVIGNLIRVETNKSRFSREKQRVELKLDFTRGLNRYYGLLPIAEALGVFKKVSTRYELPNGKKVFGKSIEDNPEEYFTQEILEEIDRGCGRLFGLGGVEDGEPPVALVDASEGDVEEVQQEA